MSNGFKNSEICPAVYHLKPDGAHTTCHKYVLVKYLEWDKKWFFPKYVSVTFKHTSGGCSET